MARLDYFLVAQNISIDQATNAVSAFNIIEEARTRGFPLLIPSLAVLTVWLAEEGDQDRDFQCILRLTLPDQASQEFPTNFRLPTIRHRLIHRLQGMPVLSEGDIRFEILLNGVERATRVIRVVQDTSLPEGQAIRIQPPTIPH